MATGTKDATEQQGRARLLGAVVVPVDQVIYAVSNLVPLIALSRSVDQVEFGQIALAQSLVVGLAVVGRAYFATPLLAITASVAVRSETIGALTRLSVVVAAAGAAGLVLLAAIPMLPLPGPMTTLLLCLGLPAVFPVEIKRLSFIRADRSTLALATDGTWLLAELAVLMLLPLAGFSVEAAAVLCWSLGAFAAAAVAFALAKRHSVSGETVDKELERLNELERLSELGRGFLTEALLLVARVQGYFFTLAIVSGSAAVGGVRFAFALVAPVNTALAGWRTFATGQFRQQHRREHRQQHQQQHRHELRPLVVGPPAVAAAALVAIAALVPDRLVDAISGNADTGPYLLAVAAAVALSAIDIVVQAFLAASERTDRLWIVRVVEVAAWLVLLLIVQPATQNSVARLILIAATIGTTAWILVYVLTRRKDHRQHHVD